MVMASCWSALGPTEPALHRERSYHRLGVVLGVGDVGFGVSTYCTMCICAHSSCREHI